ncbi:MAG TPA: slipin family protein [bacterium]|nr:slipin family protein [bacterium]
MSAALLGFGIIVGFFAFIYLLSCLKVINQYERGVVYTLGVVQPVPREPGITFVFRPFQTIKVVDIRTITLDVPVQEVITRDNVTVRVNAVAYFRVLDPIKAINEVENFIIATSQIAQTTLRSVLGESELDHLLSEREHINQKLQEIIDHQTDPWGIKVSIVEVKDVELPESLRRAMARQAEAERERRAKIIAAEGEFQASERLAQASDVLNQSPMSLQLRFLQTLVEISAEKNSTIILPVPVDLLAGFVEKMGITLDHGTRSRPVPVTPQVQPPTPQPELPAA